MVEGKRRRGQLPARKMDSVTAVLGRTEGPKAGDRSAMENFNPFDC